MNDRALFEGDEDALRDVERFADKMPGGFFVYRAGGREELIYVNDATLGIFGCATLDEFLELTGGTFHGLVHPDDLAAVRLSIDEQIAASGDDLDRVEYRILRRDGSVRWVDDYGRRVHTDNDDVYYVFISDITEKRKAQALSLELERQKHLSEAKSSFLFNISHDIRTPMNAIVGFTALARRHIDDRERLEEYLRRVDESNQHMLALIDDLLEMSQIDSGQIKLRAEVCDLREQLDIALSVMAAQIEEKGLTLETDVGIPPDEVCVDAHRFRRIMTNLIGNAVKFTDTGGTIRVAARSKQVSESGYARYEFEVADTGVGMSEEFMQRIFKAFEREDTSTRTGYLGAGLGLSIVKSLLDIMGGSISVRSKKGEGSTFTFSLPLKLAGGASAAVPTPAQEHRAEGEHRILLVEDIEINRMLAETILEEAGFLVESVSDGCDAVEAITNRPAWYYDLVLMDIQMPVMNGYEATRAIRAIGRPDTATLPIIALSANARDEDKRMSMESGMNNHIAKPFDVANLITTVNDHIRAREQNAAGKTDEG